MHLYYCSLRYIVSIVELFAILEQFKQIMFDNEIITNGTPWQ